jgi:hypothetical protein
MNRTTLQKMSPAAITRQALAYSPLIIEHKLAAINRTGDPKAMCECVHCLALAVALVEVRCRMQEGRA